MFLKSLATCAVVMSSISVAVGNDRVYFYGVDFTEARAYAVTESPAKFATAFDGINVLLIQEPDKYDFSNVVGALTETVLAPVMQKNSECSFSSLITTVRAVEPFDYAGAVADYDLPQTEGCGLIIFARLLDKAGQTAVYDVVLFDIATREVLGYKQCATRAGGFGLRNYWANSVYGLTKTLRFAI